MTGMASNIKISHLDFWEKQDWTNKKNIIGKKMITFAPTKRHHKYIMCKNIIVSSIAIH